MSDSQLKSYINFVLTNVEGTEAQAASILSATLRYVEDNREEWHNTGYSSGYWDAQHDGSAQGNLEFGPDPDARHATAEDPRPREEVAG